MDFELSLVSRPPESLVRLQGDLDLATSPLVSRRLGEAIDAGCRRMLVDLSRVTFVDASTLGVFARTKRALRDLDGMLRFIAYQPTFVRLCRATGLARPFGLVDLEVRGRV